MQHPIDLNMKWENHPQCDWNYKVGDQVRLRKYGILCKSEIWYESDPWTITSLNTNGRIRVQHGNKSE